ncbi:MAG: 1-acyl-sn-glycerol-3-phosphate acyltransferase [Myxococcales bacterium]|nr:1-acyl-sn-glycerol-3-phosphate acyltransferase [Myxococcales bacterium]
MAKINTELVKGAVRQVAGWAFTAAYVPGIIATCSVVSPERRSVLGPRAVRGWGTTMASIAGVQVRYTAKARAALDQREPRVLIFNHGSTLDVLTGAALLPEGGVLVVKSEMLKIPLLGWGCKALGSVFLDRGDRERAYASLQDAASRIISERLQVLIAPEGTRSKDGKLGRFKLGAFVLAAEAKVPILPVVLHDHTTLWPYGRIAPHEGVAVIDVLDPIQLTSTDPEALRGAADSMRQRYEQALTDGPSD